MRAYLRRISRRLKPRNPSGLIPTLRALAAVSAFAFAACGSPPSEPEKPARDPGDFSGSLAWAELEALAEAPRSLGSDGAAAARELIKTRLAASGIAVETLSTTAESKGFGPLALTHLVAVLPGASADRIVLVAPYDSGQYDGFSFVGANDGASGAALLLEVARVLKGRALPYTVELVWIEGEGRLGHGNGDERELRWLGSQGLAQRWAETGHLAGIRLLVSFNRVCDADLHVARDSGSHREFRESFWKAAHRLGLSDAFSPSRGYESVTSSQVAFREHGVRQVVAIEDTAFGGEEAPGRYAGKDDVIAHCSRDSLDAVGRVAVEAVGSISEQLAKIDRFARMPSAEPEAKPKPKREAPLDPGDSGGAAPQQHAPEPAAEASPPAGAGAEAPDAAGKL
jgi:glutaminyl-peptide cyclotransferase